MTGHKLTAAQSEMEYPKLEKKIDYQFKNRLLLDESLRHSSYVNELNEPGLKDNERLEFLGDAVLSLTVGHMLIRLHPGLNEGDLSKMRANLVNEFQLAGVAREIDLGSYILLGKGELQTNGRQKNSILADSYEALVAAVYLDGGFEAAVKIIEKQFESLFSFIKESTDSCDYKTRLQELVQKKYGATPDYSVICESGPPHDKTFVARLRIEDVSTEGMGKSKKMAEQDAAGKALKIITGQTI